MRVTTAFRRLLRLPGASVVDVSFGDEGIVVTVRLRRRRRRRRTVTITPSAPNETSATLAPGRRSRRLNAVLTRTSPPV